MLRRITLETTTETSRRLREVVSTPTEPRAITFWIEGQHRQSVQLRVVAARTSSTTITDRLIEKVKQNVKHNNIPKQCSRIKGLQWCLISKRRSYDVHERAAIVKTIDQKKYSIVEAVTAIRAMKGFEGFSENTLRRMRRMDVRNKRGRTVKGKFDEAMLGHIVYSVIEKDDSQERLSVLANVCHSYAIIERAAKMAQFPT